MNIELPDFSLVVLIGASGSGKSTFAAKHFLPTETLSSDYFRGLVSDDETSLEATNDAFDALHHLLSIRLRRRKLTVIDATNVTDHARKSLLALAAQYHAIPVAIVLDVPAAVCHARNRERTNRNFGPHVVERHIKELRKSLRVLRREGFRYSFVFDSEAAIAEAKFTRVPLWTDRRDLTGPFDIIGDVHGCYDELTELLDRLGYRLDPNDGSYRHPGGRRLVFLGDLVDRGPKVVGVISLVMNCVLAGTAFCVPGNHDVKLMRALQGRDVQKTHGLQNSLDQFAALDPADREAIAQRYVKFIDGLVSHMWLDGGRLVVAHAGMKEEMHGRASARIRDFALYGETTGETDEFGLPVRWNWAAEYRGDAAVVYGHTPVPEAQWLNNTIDIDTGCVFGGALTALRWPEKVLVSVAAARVYAEAALPLSLPLSSGSFPLPLPLSSARSSLRRGEFVKITDTATDGSDLASAIALPDSPLLSEERAEERGRGRGNEPEERGRERGKVSLQWQHDDLLDIADYTGKRMIETRLGGRVTIAEGNAAAALEVMSRFAAHPRWIPYLPPTMSPVETSKSEGYLERPEEAFAYFASRGVSTIVCQEKHMGSRAVLVVCRTAEAAHARFGASGGGGDAEQGVVLSRTGRPFLSDSKLQSELIAEASRAIAEAGLWDEWETDWCVLDCEILPWNAKAQGLLKEQYAPVAAAGRGALRAERLAASAAAERGVPGAQALADTLDRRLRDIEAYSAAYVRYCWPVTGLDGIQIAPFHVLAVEGRTMLDRDHHYHIGSLSRLAAVSPRFHATDTLTVDLGADASRAAGVRWWQDKTDAGGEGMVVKPLAFLPPPRCQPAVKVRGREYLRIIYGPEYTEPENLSRLLERGLGAKRALASREFALGVEGLERFVRREPLRRVHECAFGVLALESEPVDPRL